MVMPAKKPPRPSIPHPQLRARQSMQEASKSLKAFRDELARMAGTCDGLTEGESREAMIHRLRTLAGRRKPLVREFGKLVNLFAEWQIILSQLGG